MAHQRTTSIGASDALKEPHSVSLKVLRLSRPSLAIQHPLPATSTSPELSQAINPTASLAYPSNQAPGANDAFVLSPLLTLPPSFGSAYVGETFSCTLCANNDLLVDVDPARRISAVRIEAEMKTPTMTVPLDVAFAMQPTRESSMPDDPLSASGDDEKDAKGRDLKPGDSSQGIVDFHLKEEGNHVLAVTVSYTETGPTSGRIRTFRKLYQFVARPCLIVRTKIGPLPDAAKKKRWALEAQLENTGEDTIVLEAVTLDEKQWCNATSLNWELGEENDDGVLAVENPVLGPGDVQQVCFLIEQRHAGVDEDVDGAGRLLVGMLSIEWRGSMGNKGSLSTGWLGTRLR